MAITISGSGITSANIADSAITSTKIADSAVTSTKITDGTITTDDILASDVNSLKSGRKNLIINGGMDVWQRGTSFSSAANGQYVIDRWQTFGASLTCAISRSTDVPADQGFKYSAQINRTSHGLPFLRQPIEDFSTLISGRTVTLSFWAKSDVACTFETDLGDVGNITHSVTTSWQKFTALYPSTLNPSYTAVDFQSNSSSAATMHITGIQLELGSVATDFEHRSYGEELALCQRYYERWDYASGNDRKTGGVGWAGAMVIPLLVQKRTECTVTHSDIEIRDSSNILRTITNILGSVTSFNVYNGNGVSSGSLRTTSSTAYIAFDAEL